MTQLRIEDVPEFSANEIDNGILGVVLVLRDAGVKTFSSCQGGGYGWGHGYLRPTVCFEGDENEGERAERIATEAGYQVFQVNRAWYTRDGEREGPFWELEFVAGAACRADKDRERIVRLTAQLEARSRPVSDEEWATSRTRKGGLWRDWVDAIIAARKAKP